MLICHKNRPYDLPDLDYHLSSSVAPTLQARIASYINPSVTEIAFKVIVVTGDQGEIGTLARHVLSYVRPLPWTRPGRRYRDGFAGCTSPVTVPSSAPSSSPGRPGVWQGSRSITRL